MSIRKVVVYIASSLDGYIATTNHEVQWLDLVEGEKDNGITDFYASVDTVLMGRTTYDWIVNHVDDFPYVDKACYVFSRASNPNTSHVTFVNEDITHFIHQLQQENGKNIWLMGGGDLIASFLEKELVDEIRVTVAPVLLGDGISLFRMTNNQTSLRLIGSKRYNQFIELRYEVIR